MDIGQDSCKKVVDRSKDHDRCGVDRSRYRCKEYGDCIPDIREKVSNCLKSGTNAVPDSNKKILN